MTARSKGLDEVKPRPRPFKVLMESGISVVAMLYVNDCKKKKLSMYLIKRSLNRMCLNRSLMNMMLISKFHTGKPKKDSLEELEETLNDEIQKLSVENFPIKMENLLNDYIKINEFLYNFCSNNFILVFSLLLFFID